MKADISSAAVYTDFQGLARLRNAAKEDSPETLRAVAQQFEALFMQMMLKNMRDASLGEGIFDNDQTQFYQEMFDKQISISMSEGQGLGIADMIVRQLSRPASGDQGDSPEPPAILQRIDSEVKIKTPDDFVSSLRPAATKAGNEIGVEAEILLAQAALETGWGKAVIKHPDGRSSYNLFGIKADSRWQGERVISSTIEYEHGIAVKHNETFRSYGSYEESFQDYVEFLKTNKRYDHALAQTGDAVKFVSALQDAGYATDPDYAQKINELLQQPAFSMTDDSIKET